MAMQRIVGKLAQQSLRQHLTALPASVPLPCAPAVSEFINVLQFPAEPATLAELTQQLEVQLPCLSWCARH